jgi:hypothetical protein
LIEENEVLKIKLKPKIDVGNLRRDLLRFKEQLHEEEYRNARVKGVITDGFENLRTLVE